MSLIAKRVRVTKCELEGMYGTVIGVSKLGSYLVEFNKVVPGGHNGGGNCLIEGREGASGHCRWLSESSLDVIKKEEFKVKKFRVGDTVQNVSEYDCNRGLIGKKGVIIGFNRNGSALVEFDEQIKWGHEGLGDTTNGVRGKRASCWYFADDALELVKRKEVVKPTIIKVEKKLPQILDVYYGNVVTCIFWDDGTQTKAVCAKGDVYDKNVGFAIAYTKKIHGKLDK